MYLRSPWMSWRLLRPTTSNGHRFILVAIDYFTKWVEEASFATVTKNVVAWFIRHNLICRYGVPERIITDNGTNINNMMITELYKQFRIQHYNSSPYRPKMNGVVEATNKNINKIVQKMTVTVVPQNFPSHIPQDMSRIISKLFKMPQGLHSQTTLLSQSN